MSAQPPHGELCRGVLGTDGSPAKGASHVPSALRTQGDANRSDTDEDKTSTHLEEDFDKFRDLRATGVCKDNGDKDGGGAACTDLA